MPEHRARKHHQDRVAETLRLEIATMLEGELSDPRIDFCYVTEVALTGILADRYDRFNDPPGLAA